MNASTSSQTSSSATLVDFAHQSLSFLDEMDAWVEAKKKERAEIEQEMEQNKKEFRIKHGLWI